MKPNHKVKMDVLTLERSLDGLSPISVLLRLRASVRGPMALLEGEDQAVVVLDPIERLELLRRAPGSAPDPEAFANLGRRLESYRLAEETGARFAGGAIGYLGYECSGYLERIPRKGAIAPVREAGSQGPKYYDARLAVFGSAIAIKALEARITIRTYRYPTERGLGGARRRQKRILAALASPVPAEREHLPDVGAAARARESELLGVIRGRGALGAAGFKAGVRKIREHIRRGDIFQCVLSEGFEFPLGADALRVYRILRALNPAPYRFYLDFGDGDVLLGASPEMLVGADAGVIRTMPIAGTRPRGKTLAQDRAHERNLLASSKEKAEHLMLVDLGRNDLGRVAAPGTVKVVELMKLHRFARVMHLVSVVEAKLRTGRKPWDALASCFPAGTLSGAPKIRAMQILAGLEPRERGAYGGAVVYRDFSGRLDTCITIRSLHVRDGVARLQAGAGVVADSHPQREYEEVLHKTRSLREAIFLARKPGRRRASGRSSS